MSRDEDPIRLSEVTPQSSLGQLLASAKNELPSEQALAQLAERLAPVLEPLPVPPAAPASGLLVKVGVAVGAAVLVSAGVWALRRSHAVSSAPSPALSVSVSVPVTAPGNGAPPLAPEPASSALAPAADTAALPSAPRKPMAEAPKSVNAGPTEPVLLEQARRALASSPATALALTNQHAARFPHGVLAQEREVIAIEALRRLGRGAEADRRAAAFAHTFPGSAHQRMVEDAAPK